MIRRMSGIRKETASDDSASHFVMKEVMPCA